MALTRSHVIGRPNKYTRHTVIALIVAVVVLVCAVVATTLVGSRWTHTATPIHPSELVNPTPLGDVAPQRTPDEMLRRARQAAADRGRAIREELDEREHDLITLEELVTAQETELNEGKSKAQDRLRSYRQTRDHVSTARDAVADHSDEVRATLARISSLPVDEARTLVLNKLDAELIAEHPTAVERAVAARITDPVDMAREILSDAITRQSVSHADGVARASGMALAEEDSDKEVQVAALAELASATNTELAIDDDRSTASLRSLDPLDREVARRAGADILEHRLTPEGLASAIPIIRSSVAASVREIGERAMWEVQMDGRSELAELIGTLNYRFSYGQNALLHCKETGFLCQILASEVGLDPALGRLCGMLHDIGKACDHHVEGSHAVIGADVLTLMGVPEEVAHAVRAHHYDVDPSSSLALLTISADAISASRPGARRDTLTTYLARLEQLQTIATRHKGVERAFPLQAGREVRIAVKPSLVKDPDVAPLCQEIAREIEAEMNYPGMIKVTVIRETAATATAK